MNPPLEKNGVAFVYRLLDPRTNATRYIGVTGLTLQQRLSRHLSEARRGSRTHRHCWMRQLLALDLAPQAVLVEKIAACDRQSRERYWIQYYVANGADLTNRTNGGESIPSGPRPPRRPDTTEKIRAKLLGQRRTPEQCARISAALVGLQKNRIYGPLSPETKRKMSDSKIGKKQSPEHSAKIRAKIKGKTRTQEQCARISSGKKGVPMAADVLARMKANPPHARLQPEDVRQIRLLRQSGLKEKEIAASMGVARATVATILQGRTWSHVS